MVKQWLESVVPSALQHKHIALQVNFVFTLVFFGLILIFIATIIFYRIRSNYKQQRILKTEARLSRFFNSNVFDAFMPSSQIHMFQSVFLTNRLATNVAIKQFLVFAENFKGESIQILRKLFCTLNLDEFLYNELANSSWFRQTKALYVMSELGLKNDALVRPFLVNSKEELREQAIFYFIKTADENPLVFLEDIKEELNVWEQIYIEDSLRYFYKGPDPDFTKWLSHKFTSVIIFSVRMIQVYNQFESIPALLVLIDHADENVRLNVIRALRKLSYETLPELIIERFKNEQISVQKEMLLAIHVLGSKDNFVQLQAMVHQEENPEIVVMLHKYSN